MGDSGFNAGVDAIRHAEAQAKKLDERLAALERRIEEVERAINTLTKRKGIYP